MRVNRVSIANVRSFLDAAELELDPSLTILIGPNGGGKTNLLDTLFLALRRHVFMSTPPQQITGANGEVQYHFLYNDILNDRTFDRHSAAANELRQRVELDLVATSTDIENMRAMQADAEALLAFAGDRYRNSRLERAGGWNIDAIRDGAIFSYAIDNSGVDRFDMSAEADWFLQYLQIFETDALLRDHAGMKPLSAPLLYLPVNRSHFNLQASLDLPAFDPYEARRTADATSSKATSNTFALALGTLAEKYARLRNDDNVDVRRSFYEDPQMRELTSILEGLGYRWKLVCTDTRLNRFEIQLTKQGSSFSLSAASSGERELMTYLFAIYGLNVRNAFLIIDEPELHLHPKWQKALLGVFSQLAEKTGNQFLLATHSPTFVTPDSVCYVSRVFSDGQRSRVVRLDAENLPNAKHLLNIVSSQNNERIFFADFVLLCEGVSDRIFFEAILDRHGREHVQGRIIEIISVGGKGMFSSYEMILKAASIPYAIVADLDYVTDVGTEAVKRLFAVDNSKIKKDVVDNVTSLDGERLVADIQHAIDSGSWEHASGTWDYIKSRRQRLAPSLSEGDQDVLNKFLREQALRGVHILSRGALEQYLPVGYGRKDVDKLIELLESAGFWENLPAEGRGELEVIAASVLQRATPGA